MLFTRARFPEFVQGARIHKEPTGRGRALLSATATAAPRSVEIRGRFQRRGGKSFAAVVVGAASESHQDLYAPPSRRRRRRLGAREDEGRLLRRPRPELISLAPSLPRSPLLCVLPSPSPSWSIFTGPRPWHDEVEEWRRRRRWRSGTVARIRGRTHSLAALSPT